MHRPILTIVRSLLPNSLYRLLSRPYHFLLAFFAMLWHRNPSRRLVVVGVTGTKGKSSVTEMVGRIFEADGKKTAIISTIHFSIAGIAQRNLLKMTIPGRFLLQKLLRDAVRAGCTHAVIEMSSEGARQFRQRFVDMDILIFTHLAPEHIESHGSIENYIDAKLDIGRTLVRSPKRPRVIIAKRDDAVTPRFFSLSVEERLPFSLDDAQPLSLTSQGACFTFRGTTIRSHLLGTFNVENMIAASVCAERLGIPLSSIKKGIENLDRVPGRMEEISMGQPFRVFVDYAHTKESLEAVYSAVGSPRICVLGNTGGGRDRWKRPLMAQTAEVACAHVILTNEDPYDENPMSILEEMKAGMKNGAADIVLDRREAIERACVLAGKTPGSTVLITGKGTDPFMMGPGGQKTPWDDREVARAVLAELGYATE